VFVVTNTRMPVEVIVLKTMPGVRRVTELEKAVFDRTADIELVKEEINHAEVLVASCLPCS
jgi:hypothetical protein